MRTTPRFEPPRCRSLFTTAVGLWLAFALVSFARAQTPAYTVIDLGSPSGTISEATAVNNSGQITGTTGTGAVGDPTRAVLWTVQGGGTVTSISLGTLPGGNTSEATAINDAGLIGGYSDTANNGGYHAARFSVAADGSVTRTDLGAFPAPDNGEGFGYGINAAGQVAGYNYLTSAQFYHAVLFDKNSSGAASQTDLGTLGGNGSIASAINDAGLIAGNSQAVPNTVAGSHPFFATLWTPNGDGTFTATNLGTTPGGVSSGAGGLNNAGQVVGNVGPTSTSSHAALFTLNGSSPATVKDLGTLGANSVANAINDAGQIVGSFVVTKGSTVTHGFLYTAAAGMRDFNTLVGSSPVATVITAQAGGRIINKFGQIAMTGTVGGKQHAVLLTPTTPPTITNGSTRETTLLAGTAYTAVPVFTNPASGSRNTAVGFLDGTAGTGGTGTYGHNRDVTTAFVANPAATPLASDAADLEGAAPDTFTVQMTYAPGFADAYFGNGGNARLGWFDGKKWANAVDGNTGGVPVFAGDRAYNAATDFHLGTHGIDTAHGVVWAVVNHGGLFGVTLNPDVLKTVKSTSRSGTATTLTIDSFVGHVYQLQRAGALTGSPGDFADVEAAQNGATGTTLYLTHDDGPAALGIYRIKLDP